MLLGFPPQKQIVKPQCPIDKQINKRRKSQQNNQQYLDTVITQYSTYLFKELTIVQILQFTVVTLDREYTVGICVICVVCCVYIRKWWATLQWFIISADDHIVPVYEIRRLWVRSGCLVVQQVLLQLHSQVWQILCLNAYYDIIYGIVTT